jgi:hypothetical protein
VRIIGLLSWYEEPVSWLAETVASAAKVCDHLVAVDGPYAEFPGGLEKTASPTEQASTILHTAAGMGMGCTVHASRQPWWGNEVEKRTFMFRLAENFSTPDDWFLVIDADEVVIKVPDDFREALAKTELDVAKVLIWERGDQDAGLAARRLFRALPGMRYDGCHYVVTVPTETGVRVLSGDDQVQPVEPFEELWDLRLEHRSPHRSSIRNGMKAQYYAKLPELEQVKRF